MSRRLMTAAALAGAAAIGGGAAVAGWEAADADPPAAPAAVATSTSTETTARPTANGGLSVAEIYRQANAGVVQVRAATGGDGFEPGGEATGSGFVIDGEGHVITNSTW